MAIPKPEEAASSECDHSSTYACSANCTSFYGIAKQEAGGEVSLPALDDSKEFSTVAEELAEYLVQRNAQLLAALRELQRLRDEAKEEAIADIQINEIVKNLESELQRLREELRESNERYEGYRDGILESMEVIVAAKEAVESELQRVKEEYLDLEYAEQSWHKFADEQKARGDQLEAELRRREGEPK